MPITCKSCLHGNRLNASYCGRCAHPLTGVVNCPSCGARNPFQQNFCNSCGSPLAGRKRTRSASIPRRLITAALARISTYSLTINSAKTELSGVAKHPYAHLVNPALLIAAIVATGAIIRLWGLASTPEQITSAEEAFIAVARLIESEGWIGLSHGLLNGPLTGYAYVLALWTTLLGDDLVVARMLSGIASLAAIGMTYLLVANLLNRRAALFATLFMAVGVWPLTYARLALPTSFLLLVAVTALYFLIRSFQTASDESSRRNRLVISGALVGITLYLDFAALIFAAAIVSLWLKTYIADAISPRVLAERFAAFAIPALIISLPLWTAFAIDPALRQDAASIFLTGTQRGMESESLASDLLDLIANVINTGRALVWSIPADELGQGGGRIVDPLMGLLVLLGLLICLRRWRDDSCGTLLAFLLVIAFGVGLTRPEGMFARLFLAAPAVFTLAGLAVDWLLGWMKGRMPTVGIAAMIAILGAGALLLNLTTYYAHPIGKDPALWVASVMELSPSWHALGWNLP